MVKIAALIITASVLCAGGQPQQFFTFAEFERLSSAGRAGYIAGMFDGSVHFATDQVSEVVVKRQMMCLTRSKITNAQLAEGVLEFGRSRPALRGGTVGPVLVAYITALCPDLLGVEALDAIMNELK
jgi:hypothetical protein